MTLQTIQVELPKTILERAQLKAEQEVLDMLDAPKKNCLMRGNMMSILTLSSPIKEILGKIGGEPESRAVSLLISGIKENLKECELEILEIGVFT